MKMTIVIDSEDTKGIDAALKMTKLMHEKYVESGGSYGRKESFGKIEFIKMLRKFMKESIEHLDDPDSDQVKDINDIHNLRNAKRFADRIFTGQR
jgi:hypothetical protein